MSKKEEPLEECLNCGFKYKKSWNLRSCPQCGMCLNCEG